MDDGALDLDDGPDGALDWPFWRRSFSFIPNDKLWLFPDLDDGALDLELSGRSFSFTRNEKLWSFLDLDAGALDLSFWSWALAQFHP